MKWLLCYIALSMWIALSHNENKTSEVLCLAFSDCFNDQCIQSILEGQL